MTTLLVILHIIVSLALIVIVLLQSGKGAEMGASFGAGGSQSVFGAGGGTTFLSKLTTSAAIIFMLTSLTLAFLSGKGGSSSIMSSKQKAKPAQQVPAQAPAQKQPSGQPLTSQPPQTQPTPQAPATPK
ncbi:preprotein translocase, SecG subunit [Geotalea daltonii FRC-32]|uniref:Protein-export membrane protein SecG n=1 Tax=Geotalea daltonii (strain DSM 22248 / JCM 15807 / FRC-32) TaxID=316067 RepID=B9M2C5_GEODF|nr:preprotein translocase subunit SecG [Geotalea daltonii]ACM21243.1 preprotein translocase, SecG subunit [Geotalea daltonii FRC-32]